MRDKEQRPELQLPAYVLESLTPEQFDAIRTAWLAQYRGPEHAYDVVTLGNHDGGYLIPDQHGVLHEFPATSEGLKAAEDFMRQLWGRSQ